MSLLAYAAAAIVLLGMVGTGIYKVKQWGGNEVRAEWNAANEKARAEEAAKSEAAAKALEAERAKRKVVYRTITQTVDRIVDRPVYSNQCLDSDGLRCLSAAINGQSADSCKLDGTVPKPAAPDRDRRQSGIAMDDWGG